MSTTYTAWDGNDYEWPPPKDWYQAVDNRWWAPDTGPAAMGADASLTDATTQMSQEAEILNPAAARQHNIAQSDLPAWAKPSDVPTNRTTYIPELTDNDTSGGGSASVLLGIGAVVMTLIVVGLVYFIFLNGDSEKSAQEPSATPQETAAPDPISDVTTPETPPTVVEVPTSVEVPTTTVPEEVTTTVAIETDSFPAFEAAAKTAGIAVTDQTVISGQAQTFCNDASAVEDSNAYQELRSSKLANLDEISAEQAGQILDLYLIHFCPGVATQVGVS